MSKGLKIERVFRLPSPAGEVWSSLVSPELIQSYLHNRELASSLPSVGSVERCPAFKSGGILEYVEGRKVKFSTFDPRAGLKDQPQNYLHISYELAPCGEGTELRVLIENFMEDDRRYEHSAAGWQQTVEPALSLLAGS